MNYDHIQNKHVQLINENNNEELPMEGCTTDNCTYIDFASCPGVDNCGVDYTGC